MKEKSRCSILFHLLVSGAGADHDVETKASASAAAWRGRERHGSLGEDRSSEHCLG
jgi:hypothetical protein